MGKGIIIRPYHKQRNAKREVRIGLVGKYDLQGAYKCELIEVSRVYDAYSKEKTYQRET